MGVVALACDVGEDEDDVRAGGNGIEEVPPVRVGVIAGMQIETLERRQCGG